MSLEWPTRIGELSTYALNQAVETLEKEAGGLSPDVDAALAVLRLVTPISRREPWYGQHIDPEDTSVTVGVMMRNAFEAVGDSPEEPARHWLTRMYLPRWKQGRADYYDFLEHLMDPVRSEEEAARARLNHEQAACERSRIQQFLQGERP